MKVKGFNDFKHVRACVRVLGAGERMDEEVGLEGVLGVIDDGGGKVVVGDVERGEGGRTGDGEIPGGTGGGGGRIELGVLLETTRGVIITFREGEVDVRDPVVMMIQGRREEEALLAEFKRGEML